VDEANCSIGVVLATGGLPDEVRAVLLTVQNDLFDVGADLCTPVVADPQVPPLRISDQYVGWLEQQCDRFNDELEPLRSFILPGGSPGAALLHVSRTLVRRAERSTWAAWQVHGESMSSLPATYLNRLSDLLFILARYANRDGDGVLTEVLWQPGRRQRG
jgi:cob(I)alamin adenosyltransferase